MARPTTTTLGWPLGTRPAGSPILPALTGTPKILCAGDSITRGQGSTDGSGWRGILDARLTDAGIAHEFVGPTTDANGLKHYGNSGWAIADLNTGIAGTLATYTPDILILLIARNDMDDATEAANAPTAYGTLLSTIYTASAPLRIVACHITPEESATFWARTQTFRAAVPAVWAASSADGDGLMVTCGAGLDLAPLCQSHLGDGVHPNDVGYGLIADRIWPALVNALGRDASW